jgi:hypothetical protein
VAPPEDVAYYRQTVVEEVFVSLIGIAAIQCGLHISIHPRNRLSGISHKIDVLVVVFPHRIINISIDVASTVSEEHQVSG